MASFSQISDPGGSQTKKREEVKKVCKDFYTELFTSKTTVPFNIGNVEDYIEDENDVPEVLPEEIEAALRNTKSGKAPGPDGIPCEVLKAGGRKLWSVLAKLFTDCLNMQQIPAKWKTSKTVLLFKKGDPEDIKNYRPICLLSSIYKLFTNH